MRHFSTNGRDDRSSRTLRMDAAFDFSTLLTRCLGNEPLASQIAHSFSERLQADICKLEQALAHGDMIEMEALAHRIKGTAANVTAERFERLANSIEQQARNNDRSNLQHSLEQFRRETERLDRWVSRRISRVNVSTPKTV